MIDSRLLCFTGDLLFAVVGVSNQQRSLAEPRSCFLVQASGVGTKNQDPVPSGHAAQQEDTWTCCSLTERLLLI